MQKNIVPIHNPASECYVGSALVKCVLDKGVMLETEFGIIKADIAFSCLVTPQCGDRVLFSRSKIENFVLAVLERDLSQNISLDFPADVTVNTPSGNVTINAAKDLNLSAGEKNTFHSPHMHMNSEDIDLTTSKLAARIRKLSSTLGQVEVIADTITSVTQFLNQRVGNIVRWVEGVETLNIGDFIQNVRKSMISHSGQAAITAKKDIKIDGERIHMG